VDVDIVSAESRRGFGKGLIGGFGDVWVVGGNGRDSGSAPIHSCLCVEGPLESLDQLIYSPWRRITHDAFTSVTVASRPCSTGCPGGL